MINAARRMSGRRSARESCCVSELLNSDGINSFIADVKNMFRRYRDIIMTNDIVIKNRIWRIETGSLTYQRLGQRAWSIP
jgi:hypothetical protein